MTSLSNVPCDLDRTLFWDNRPTHHAACGRIMEFVKAIREAVQLWREAPTDAETVEKMHELEEMTN